MAEESTQRKITKEEKGTSISLVNFENSEETLQIQKSNREELNSLRMEIASLKKYIESLKAELGKVKSIDQRVTLLENKHSSLESSLKDLESQLLASQAAEGTGWRPPAEGWLKLNVEAVVEEGKVAIGAVVRDCTGCLIAAMSKSCPPEDGLETDSAAALLEALLWADCNSIARDKKLVVELTSKLVLDVLVKPVAHDLAVHLIALRDGCDALASMFERLFFSYIDIVDNKVALAIACRLLMYKEGQWTMVNPPFWLQEEVEADLQEAK